MLRQLTNTSFIPIVLIWFRAFPLPINALGSCLDLSESSMARKLPGGQQVTTGVLVGEEGSIAVVRTKLCTTRPKPWLVKSRREILN